MVQVHDQDIDLAFRLLGLRQKIDRLELEFAQAAAAFEQSQLWDDQGFNSGIDWIRFNCCMTSTAAADRVRVGEQLAELAESVEAVDKGEIGFAHLTVMARTANAVGKRFEEEALLALARENSPGKFHYKCLHYRHAVDSKTYAEDEECERERRGLRLSTTEDGWLLLSGGLDPEGGAAVRSALEPLAQRSGAYDDRNLEQRYADALIELAQGGRPATLQVTASMETLMDLPGAPGGETEFSLPLSSATVRRMACDCSLRRVLLDQKSMVIDVGRSERTLRGARRMALTARDQHCRWPGCERPASWCEGHHLVHWIDGGETNLENIVLLCHRHHRMVHEGGWQLVRSEGGLVTVAPTVRFGWARGPD